MFWGVETEIPACQLYERFYFSPPQQSCLTFTTCLCWPEYHLDIVARSNITFKSDSQEWNTVLAGAFCLVYKLIGGQYK
jgi:hypothetical protein